MANKYALFAYIFLLGGCIEIPPAPPSQLMAGQAAEGNAPNAGTQSSAMGDTAARSMSTGGRITTLGGELSGGQNSSGGVIAGSAGDMVAGSPGSTGGSGTSAGSAAGGNPAPTCDDGVRNGAETDVDCGGACAPCPEGQACRIGQDCVAGICNELNVCMPPMCNDGVKNGAETGIDCGPSDSGCARCANGTPCQNGNECESLVCMNQRCIAPLCDDGVSNGDETDIDCGGQCAPCESGQMCLQGSDCDSGACTVWMPGPGNNDPQPNACAAPAQLGEACDRGPEDARCADGLACQLNTCVPSHCTNRVKDADETDLDCGGDSCTGCEYRDGCLLDSDCRSGTCMDSTLVCAPAHCRNAVRDENETDVDCGGGDCPGCGAGLKCRFIRDCGSQNCLGAVDDGSMEGQCADHCADGVVNGGETGADCGGPCGKTCQIGDPCLRDDDCSGILTCNLDGVAPRENGGCLPPG